MKKILPILCICFLSYHYSFGQYTKLDSLKISYSDTTQTDSVHFETGLAIFKLQFRQNLDTARTTGLTLLAFAKQKKNKNWQATAYRFIGNTYAVQANYPEALKQFIKSHTILKDIGDEKSMATTLNNIGLIYYEQGNYPEALNNMLGSLRLSEKLKDQTNLARVSNNLGNIYLRQKKYTKALEYYLNALNLKKELGDKNTISFTYNNVGLVYKDLQQYDKAIENLQLSVNAAEKIGDVRSSSRAYSNLGEVYLEKKEYANALNYLNKGIKIKEKLKDRHGLAAAYLYRGSTYLEMNQPTLARNNCLKSLSLAQEINLLIAQKDACLCLSSVFEKLGNTKQSLQYHKQFVMLQDSLFNEEKSSEIARQELQYQFDKKQLADSIAFHKEKAEQQLQFERNINTQKNKLNIIVFGGLGLLLIGGIYWKSRQKSIKLAREREHIHQLLEVDKLKDEFLANTSHELRTPLTGIIGLTESLKDGVAGKLPKIAIENLDMIANSGKRLSHLVNDILDFSKLKNKNLDLNLSPVDIYALTNIVVKLSKPLLTSKKVDLVNRIPKDISLVSADENRLQQILYNLIGNAIKFTEKGKIEVSAKEQTTTIKILVSDTGIGIAKDKYGDIFKPFEQGDGTIVRERGGTGLGLTVTKQLIELHGGTISFESQIGKGTIFTFTLKKSTAKRIDLKPKQSHLFEKQLYKIQPTQLTENSTKIVTTKTNALKILIVDDEQINRKVLQNHLALAGYIVKEATDGKEALSYFKQGDRFDLVLLDIMMPGISGYEICETIRKKFSASELPIILLTAKNRVSDLVIGFNAGANDYLTKPFSKNELLSRIKTHINLKNIHNATSKFIPTEFLRSIDKDAITDVSLGDHTEKEVTVLFTDIRGYTNLAENMTPEQNFKFVNAYVSRMGPLIQQNRGFVNQYLGDGIMALFPHQPYHALQAAIDMQKKLTIYNKSRTSEGYEPLFVGMGLHTGPLVMGIIGDVNRNDTAIIADTVNTASRMEGLTKHYGANIIVSGHSIQNIENKEQYHLRYLGKVQAKGKDQIVDIYECFDGDAKEQIELKKETLSQFKKGIDFFFNKSFSEALNIFASIMNKNPKDGTALYFKTKSELYLENLPNDWEGVNMMDKK